MNPIALEMIAPMIVTVILILTVGGVLILRPIAKRVGDLLEVMTRERLEPGRREDTEHLREILETMNQRLALMEERQDFTDRLLTSRSESTGTRSAGSGSTSAGPSSPGSSD